MKQKRKHYRKDHGPEVDLHVAIADRRGQLQTARILDVSGGGMRLLLPRGFEPAPRLGGVLRLQLVSSLVDAPVESPAAVVREEATDRGTIVGVQFLDWLGLAAIMPAELATLFNLRAGRRYEFAPTERIDVAVQGIDLELEVIGQLADLSRGGLSFYTLPVADCIIAMAEFVQVGFELPELDERLEFTGRIVHRHMVGDSVRYGVAFDEERSQRFEEQQRAIDEYVTERVGAALRALAHY
jgi:c-di-GMP-binding flagellar brake protein YcgR